MDPTPNVFVAQEPTPTPEPRSPKLLLIIIIIGVLIILGAIAIFSPKIISLLKTPTKTLTKIGSNKNNQNTASETVLQTVFKEQAITTFIVNPKSTVSFVKLEKTRIHLPPIVDTKPKEASGSFVFKADVLSKNGSVLYSSWKKFPIIKPQKDGSFEAKVLTPYQKEAVLRLKDSQEKVILTKKF